MSHDTVSCSLVSIPSSEQVQSVLLSHSQAIVASSSSRRGRPSDLSWPHLCLGVIACVLLGWQSQLDLRRLLCFDGFWHWPAVGLLTDQAIYNRLDRAATHMHTLFDAVSLQLAQRLSPWQDRSLAPFASHVLALDESELDEVGRWLPALRSLTQKDVRLRAGRLSALFDVRLQQWKRMDIHTQAATNCKVHARAMIEALTAGTLVLFDRGYFSFEWFDELTQRGLWWISRYSNRASFEIKHICYCGDGVLDAIVWLGTYRSDQAAHPVRLIRFWYKGVHYSYLTTVCDPHVLPLAEVMRLYARRWDIELGFRLLKDHLHLNLLWSAKWSVIQVQLWACLLLAQIFHGLQQEIALQEGVKVEDVSLDLLVRVGSQWWQRGEDIVEMARRWGREMGLIRPSSRTVWIVPFVDVAWVVPPPQEVLKPREKARHAHRKCHPRSQTPRSKAHAAKKASAKWLQASDQAPRVKLINGKLQRVSPNLLE